MKEAPYNSTKLVEAWVKAGIRTPKELCKNIGISEGDRQAIANNTIVSTELIANTLTYIKVSYEDGSYEFLDPWMTALKNSEAKAKISESRIGRPHTTETKGKISMSMIGRKPTAETRAKMSESHKGRKPTAETRAKMSESQRGRTHTAETRAKMSDKLKGKTSPMKGRTHTAETKAKISESRRKRHNPIELKEGEEKIIS